MELGADSQSACLGTCVSRAIYDILSSWVYSIIHFAQFSTGEEAELAVTVVERKRRMYRLTRKKGLSGRCGGWN